MNITSKRAKVILSRYEELKYLAESCAGSYNIRFDCNGDILKEVNTACHCHPEYQWVVAKTAKEFGEWLDKNLTSSYSVI